MEHCNDCKSITYNRCWTHKIHPYLALTFELWMSFVFQRKIDYYDRKALCNVSQIKNDAVYDNDILLSSVILPIFCVWHFIFHILLGPFSIVSITSLLWQYIPKMSSEAFISYYIPQYCGVCNHLSMPKIAPLYFSYWYGAPRHPYTWLPRTRDRAELQAPQ